jgi:hypothetical protein
MRRMLERTEAEEIAIRALGFLASEPERIARFLALTGLGPENIRAAAADPSFLASVLDHIGADESLLVAFAGQFDMRPETVAAAQALLSPPPAGD